MPGAWKTVIKGSAGLLLLAAAMLLVVAGRDVDGLWRSVAELSPIRLAVLCLLLSAGALLAGLRLRIIASDLGFRLSIRDSIAALSVGQIAGAIAFQLLGQLIGRSALLARRKVPFAGTALMMGYERAAALCASLLIAIAGAVYLFGDIQVTLGLEAADLVKIGIGVVAATAAGAWLVWGREAADLIRQIRLWHVLRFFRTFLLSLLVQSTTMAAYVLCAEIIAPSMSIMNIAAASALVMFAASIPISFAGFGLREMSAVLALQQIGMTPGEALAVALEIGTLSLLVVGALAVITANPVAQNSPPIELAHPTAKESFDYSNVLGWALAVASATLVFFQVFLPTNSGQINVNLADPIAIVGGLLLVALCISRKQIPRWRVPWIGLALLGMTAVIVLSFVIGVASFGWTQWAATNKLLGWFVLLAYAATGALAVQIGGEQALERILAAFAVTGATTVAIQLAFLATTGNGLSGVRAGGFAQNANSYAWQMLMVTAALGTVLRVRFQTFLLALALAGLWLSGSRAGLGAGFVLMWAIYILNRSARASVVNALILATALLTAVAIFPNLIAAAERILEGAVAFLRTAGEQSSSTGGGTGFWSFGSQIASAFVAAHETSTSDYEHLHSMVDGWNLFLQHPLTGAGLGAFLYAHSSWDNGHGLIIHSTPLWLLAECGIFGAMVFVVPFLCLLVREIRTTPKSNAGLLTILLLVAFGVMSMAHELLYQRTFWLMLGAAAACIPSKDRATESRR